MLIRRVADLLKMICDRLQFSASYHQPIMTSTIQYRSRISHIYVVTAVYRVYLRNKFNSLKVHEGINRSWSHAK